MPNDIKYNTGASISTGSIKKGNWELSTAQFGNGPTSTTGFWNSIDPPVGGYVIHSYKATGGPSIVVARNDAELVTAVKQLGANVSTAIQALDWASTNNVYITSSSYDVEMPTSGMIMLYDPLNSASWSGSKWYDLSGYGNDANVTGSFTVEGSGLRFNGSNYMVVNKSSSMDAWANEQTVAMWLNHNYTSGRRNPWDQAYGGYGTWTHEQGNSFNNYFGNAGVNNHPYVGYGSHGTPRDVWSLHITTRSRTTHRWYLNDSITVERSNPYGTLAATAARVAIGTGYAGAWLGLMGMVAAWNRALSPEEVATYYNATRGRHV